MPEYKVRWEIDVEADSPRQAAILARKIQLDPTNLATVYDVYNEDTLRKTGEAVGEEIDLLGLPLAEVMPLRTPRKIKRKP